MSFLTTKDLGNTKQFQQSLETTTIRSFDGGWNAIDTDLNMKSKYAVTLDNMERDIDGTLALRHGTKILSTLGYTNDITNCIYFNSRIICVQTNGVVWAVDGTGAATHMLLTGADPWGVADNSVLNVSFTVFNGDLIITDGVHKPLLISGHPYRTDGTANPNYNILQYLVDLGTGSNVNTPVAKYVISHSQYTVFANLAASTGVGPRKSSISISSRGTSGTFVGDAPPNDGVEIDLGPRVSLGDSEITGLVSYRDKLLVAFERGVLPVNLGVYVGTAPAVHTPTDDGFVEEFGCLSNRSLISVGDDTFYCDNIGVNSIQRVTLFNTLRPQRASQLIDPEITALIQPLTPAQIGQYVFSVYDTRHRRYMLFVPTFNELGVLTETVCFSYTNIPALKIEAWARLKGWKWQCGCRTALQNIIFCQGNKLYTYDFDNDTQNLDYLNDTTINGGLGTEISFTWELPWADFNNRMNVKKSVYVNMDTTGTADFTLSMYVDNIRTDGDGNDAPALSTDFQGGSLGGYGVAPYGSSPYGSGRPTADERLFAWPAQFKIAKLKVSGTAGKPLRVVSLSLAYLKGSIRR